LIPTRIQPLVSLAVLPLCIRIPSKSGTSSSNGKSLLNLGDLLTMTVYVPSGTAVLPAILVSLTGSSNVLQNTFPSKYSLPIVYSGVCAIRYKNKFITLCY